MKKSDLVTMPIEDSSNNGIQPYAGLTKREMFAMHAPEAPDWFESIYCEMYDSHEPLKDSYIDYKRELYFKWRKYYAEKMCEVYEC